jgi:hypothetical protein
MELKRRLDWKEHIGVAQAFREAENSRVPGIHNGPGDAYRHILGAAELTRRYGETRARIMLDANEIQGDIEKKQPREEADMDRHNNEFDIAIGRTSRTWEENVDKARMTIDASARHDGSGAGGTAKWLDRSKWSEDPAADNWPPDWSRVPADTDYPYGGEEHRYGGKRCGDADDDPMDRPIDTWTDDDVKKFMRSQAYWSSGYPGRRAMQEKVRDWHVRKYDGPGGAGRSGGSGPVHVSAHVRAGAHVSEYTRARPSR